MGFDAWRFAAFAALLTLAALTRELTAIILWLTFMVLFPLQWRWSVLYAGILFAVLFGLRLLIPADASIYTIGYTWELNTTAWRLRGAILYQGLLLPLWILLFHTASGKSAQRYGFILCVYLCLITALGVWQEVRLLMPVFILGIPISRRAFNG